MKELITIAECAKEMGMTPQAIYKRLNTDLKPFLVVNGRRKLLKAEAIQHMQEAKEQMQGTAEPAANDMVEILKRELEAKNAQIDRLTESLAAAQQLAQQAQLLQANAEQKLKLLEAPKEEAKEEQPSDGGLFKRLLKAFKG